MKIKFDTEFLNRSKKFTFIFKNKKNMLTILFYNCDTKLLFKVNFDINH